MSKNYPLVSISCITYNHAPFIRQCFDGFLMQKTNFSFEVVIHDDASTDGTKEIIEEYSARYPDVFFPMFQMENQYSKGVRGMMVRFNFPRCRGKYIALCEGDDYWTDENKLQKQVDFLEKNLNYSICFHEANVITESGSSYLFNKIEKDKTFTLKDLCLSNFISTASCLFRNNIKETPAWFLELGVGDWGLHILNAQYGEIFYMAECMSVYRWHSGGIWSRLSLEEMLKRSVEFLRILDKGLDYKYHDEFENGIQKTLERLSQPDKSEKVSNPPGSKNLIKKIVNKIIGK